MSVTPLRPVIGPNKWPSADQWQTEFTDENLTFPLELEASGDAGDATASPSTGSLTITGYAPTLSAGVLTEPDAASLTLSGLAPTVAASATAAPNAATLTLTGFAATVSAADDEPAASVAAVTTGAAGAKGKRGKQLQAFLNELRDEPETPEPTPLAPRPRRIELPVAKFEALPSRYQETVIRAFDVREAINDARLRAELAKAMNDAIARAQEDDDDEVLLLAA